MRKFPQELVDAVIDDLYKSEGRRLTEYSTVSKAWLPRIQRHLFRIIFQDPHHLEKWRNFVNRDSSRVPRCLSDPVA